MWQEKRNDRSSTPTMKMLSQEEEHGRPEWNTVNLKADLTLSQIL